MSDVIGFPDSTEALLRMVSGRSVRAGGTDLQERRHLGLARGPVADLRDVKELTGVAVAGEALRVGARTRIAALAADVSVQQQWPGLALMGVGALKFFYDIWMDNLSETTIFAFLSALIIWSLGLIADMISRLHLRP